MALQVKENVPLAPLTTFEIGGSAKYFVDVKTEDEIREALAWAKEKGIKFVVLAGGSNVLVPDEGLNALVIHIAGGEHSFAECELIADAGCDLLELIKTAGKRGLGGWEKLSGIPGTIGGAVRGNAGAFGPEIRDFVVSVDALNAETGETKEFSNSECDFSYRHSFFKDHPEWIITKVQLRLTPISIDISIHLVEETIREREKRHIQNVRAAGSYFVNPVAPKEIQEMFEKEKGMKSREGRVPAGWLIEKAGMKGATVGGAIASLQHPNYIVNQGGATSHDVLNLAQTILSQIETQFGVELHEEAAIL
ncbi:UDP-N-acetylenolpyruvoylglucosamine reductase [Candidatus Kaiserbacteria bacterium RIFCSPHIGHO2_01_FULL_54_36]|uniref:UDP-N-acetylenolpyruvoylglucosamine reductase n=1 Tax=Candidatus Kaiserbacteria bacterium RIFCSPHIGHO2_01_FULL_54_36 TaxID=1798482 RepID=A0A1F6CNQ8_9BACT|nr:MAG: UDP-N-acetylenolpyruvoylglucosamine reductase [Candidatus Kaiserbacteria bacterium RIFCSPHIGHO2_01_FULL_54_36]OGG75498.1 MAG: UDP-N-acetylenolpyruvoylglucosamine reductase [Candidatus Kaiserbacteria bacterium RIFCSPLOWO2_01_FULL_54_22]